LGSSGVAVAAWLTRVHVGGVAGLAVPWLAPRGRPAAHLSDIGVAGPAHPT